MNNGSRLLPFKGAQQEYVALLEKWILLCPSCLNRLQHPTNQPVFSEHKKLKNFESRPAADVQVSSSSVKKRGRSLEFVQVDAALIGHHDPRNLKYSGPRRKRTSEPGWKIVANRMLDLVPTTDDWHKTVNQYNLTELRKDVVKKDEIRSRFSSVAIVPVDQGDLSRTFLCALQYSRFTQQVEQSHKQTKAVLSYRNVVLISICTVLRRAGRCTQEQIRQVLSPCFSDDDAYLDKLIRGISWLHELMVKLFEIGWGCRAHALIMICKAPPLRARSHLR